MTQTTTLQQAAASYSEMVARYKQYEREVPDLRAVRAVRKLSGKGGLKFATGDEALGYYRPYILEPGRGEWIVYSARTGWHVAAPSGYFEYMG